MRIGWSLRLLMAAVVVGACSSTTTTGTVTVSTIVVAPDTVVLQQGDSVRLVANALDDQGHLVTGVAISFSSSDPTIFTVSNTGLVLAIKKGSAHVVVSGGGVAALVPVTVFMPATVVATIPVSGRPFEVATGSTRAYVATVGNVVRLDLAALSAGAAVKGNFSLATRLTFNAAGDRAYASDLGVSKIWVISSSADSAIDSIATTGAPGPMVVAGTSLLVTTDANRLYKFNLGTKVATDSISLPATSHHLLLHPNGMTLYVATRDGGTVMEVNSATMTVTRTITVGGRTQAMALSPDHLTLYVANETESYVFVVSLTSGTVTDSIPLAGGSFGLAVSSDGSHLYAGLPSAGKVQVINVATRRVVTTLVVGGTPREILFDATHQHVIVPNEGGWVDVLSP